MRLSDLNMGESAVIVKVLGTGAFRKRITEMGFVKGRKVTPRSEERRVGKECRSRWSPYH